MLLAIVMLPLVIGTLFSLWIGHRSRVLSALLAGSVTLICIAGFLSYTPQIMLGESIIHTQSWVPQLGLDIVLRLDGLSWMFALLITVIGSLIVLYAAYYLAPEDSVPKFYSLMMLFMAAMLGVVLSDNVLLLVVFWELTSLSSFLLVGYWGHLPEARAGARQALAVTGGGGLAMLGGMVLLGQIAGTYNISEMVVLRETVQASPMFVPAMLLILLGALTKSAQFPFHFWLPDAMAAPTPVSAYLHSATMVKAGVFLLMRMYPIFAGHVWFEGIVTTAGLVTLCFAAFVALFKHDLKGLLAYSTVSHLGLMTFLIGLGSPLAPVAAVFHVLNHASFKAPLFMVAGIVDHETHSRDMRRLGGLYRFMPITALLALIASAGMAGVPGTNGFLSKEMYFTEAVGHFATHLWLSWFIPLLITLAGAFSVAYSIRLVHDTFFNGRLRLDTSIHPHEPPWGMKLPSLFLVVVCLLVGILPAWLAGPVVEVAASAMVGQPLPEFHLSLWHGFNLPLLMSVVALVLGGLIYAALIHQNKIHQWLSESWFGVIQGKTIFNVAINGLFEASGKLTQRLESGSLQSYVFWLMAAAAFAVGLVMWPSSLGTGSRPLIPANGVAGVLWVLLLLTCFTIVRLEAQRFITVILVGFVGLVTSMTFVALSAPDLALTQLSVEVVSTVLMLMGLALLPAVSPVETSLAKRLQHGMLATIVGAGVGWLSWLAMTREHQSISWYFLENALSVGGGSNVVNVILVDFRGYDTFGEITVLGIAGLGVFALMQGMRARRGSADAHGRLLTFEQPPLLLRVVAALVLPFALVFSVYIFMRGHNMPGGGFIAGLITAVALVLQFMALGQEKSMWLMKAAGGQLFVRWLGMGLGIAGLTGVGAFFFSKPFLTSAFGHPVVPVLGELPLASAALFDLGVYGTVVGATLLTVSVLAQVSQRSPQQNSPDVLAQEGQA